MPIYSLKSKSFFLILFSFLCINLNAQIISENGNSILCGTDQINDLFFDNNSDSKDQYEEFEKLMYDIQLRKENDRKLIKQGFSAYTPTSPCKPNDSVYHIPVIVHVVHSTSDSVRGTGSNISDSLILQGIKDLNDGFRNRGAYSGNGNNTHPAVQSKDINIEFRLAQRDFFNSNQYFSQGSGSGEPGICRWQKDSFVTIGNANSFTHLDTDMKKSIRRATSNAFPSSHYANVYLVKTISGGVAGFAYFPSAAGNVVDGITNEASYFGSSRNNSKVHIHEFGHYLNLYHTFEGRCNSQNNNCLLDGDKVCDTPPDNTTSATTCSRTTNTCSNDSLGTNTPFLTDQNDLFEDYMDYGFQSCQNTFTQGQKDRMIAALLTSRSNLLSSSGLVPLLSLEVGLTDVSVSQISDCDTIILPSYTILNSGTTTIDSVTIEIEIDGRPYTDQKIALNLAGSRDTVVSLDTLSASFGKHNFYASISKVNTTIDSFTTNNNFCKSFSIKKIDFDTLFQDFDNVTLTPTTDKVDSIWTLNRALWYYWYSASGSTPRANTGPTGDKSGSGKYIYFRSEYVPYLNYSSLESECLDISEFDTVDYSFWYHMYGSNMGNLYVEIDTGKGWSRIDSIKGQQQTTSAASWRERSISLSKYAKNLKRVRLNTQRGLSLTGNIALDELSLVKKNGTPPCDLDLGNDTAVCSKELTLDVENTAWTYKWGDGSTASKVTVDSTDTYSLTVSDSVLGCSSTDSITVTFNVPPVVNLGSDTAQCAGQVTLDAQNTGSNYEWNTSATTQAIDADTTGEYWVKVTDGNGCESRDSIEVTIHSLPTIDLGQDTTQCAGQVTLNAQNSGSDYEWNTSDTTQSIVVNSSANYWVKVTNSNGCESSDTIEVTINDLPLVDLGSDTVQCGGTITLDAQNSGSSYEWSTAATTQRIEVDNTADYWVRVTDGNGCESRDTIGVVVHNLPTVNLGSDTTQCGGTITLNAQNTGLSYEWSTTATSQSIVVDSTASYWVKVTDGNSCESRDTIEVTILILPQVDLGPDTSRCDGSILLFGPNGASSYTWNTGSSFQFISVRNTGTYWLNVTDGSGCEASDTIEVTIFSLPQVDLGSDTIQCGGTITLDAQNSGSSYEWSTTATTQNIEVDSTAEYWVKVTDVNGCESTDRINVTIHDLPQVDLGSDTLQCGGTVTLDASNSGATYKWNTTATTQSIAVNSTAGYWVNITDGNGCEAGDTVEVTIFDLPQVDLGSDTIQCAGTIILDASNSGASFEWNTKASTQRIVADSTGEYWVKVTDGNGCESTDRIQVTIYELPRLNLGSDTAQCGGTITLDAQNSGSSFEWSTSASTQSILVDSTAEYRVKVTDGNGCEASDTIEVTIFSLPQVDLGSDTVQCDGTISLDAQNGGSSYEWNTAATTQTIVTDSTGEYWVKVTDANGCISNDTIKLTILKSVLAGYTSSIIDQTASTFTVAFTSSSANAEDHYWDFGDGSTSNQRNPEHTYQNGSYELSYIVTNECSRDTFSDSLKTPEISNVIGLGYEDQINIYPNPSNGIVNVSFQLSAIKKLKIQVFDITGRQLLQKNFDVQTGKVDVPLDLSNYIPAMYTLAIWLDNSVSYEKIIIKD